MSSSSLPQPVRSTTPLTSSPLPRPPQNSQLNRAINDPSSPKLQVLPVLPAIQPLLRNHPSVRISSSPSSSPRIAQSPPIRTRSIRPEMNNFMDLGVEPGADFFDADSSGEEDAWEDDNETREFSEGLDLGIRDSIVSGDFEDDFPEDRHVRGWERGRARERDPLVKGTDSEGFIRALPPFNQLPARDSGTATMNNDNDDDEEETDEHGNVHSPHRKGTKKARQMSVRRLGQVKVVHNHGSGSSRAGTPRGSLMSNKHDSSNASPVPGLPKFGELRGGEGNEHIVHTHHRRNTSESIRADSILNAHVATMRALESLSPTASFSFAHAHAHAQPLTPGEQRHSHSVHHTTIQKSASGRPLSDRHIKLASIATADLDDPDRPAHLPSHFIKTPYPFTSKKEFPKPRTRPRNYDLDNGQIREFEDGANPSENDSVHDQAKGKHVLGIVASDGTFDLRSRLERNKDAQGVIRSRSDTTKPRAVKNFVSGRDRGEGDREFTIFVSLRSRRGDGGVVDRLERVVIPVSLTTTSPSPEPKGHRRDSNGKPSPGDAKKRQDAAGDGIVTLDFDDAFLSTCLQEAYRSLAGGWFWRAFSARTLKFIRLGHVSVWSGSPLAQPTSMTRRLLGARGGLEIGTVGRESLNPFTEHNLLNLFKHPKKGKARYTWVHWARRVATSNALLGSCHFNGDTREHKSGRRKSLYPDAETYLDEDGGSDESHARLDHDLDTITTIQLIHSFSPPRIVLALGTIFVLSIAAAFIWICIGVSAWRLPDSRGRSERVSAGMAVGILAFILQMVAFVAWIGLSWAWV